MPPLLSGRSALYKMAELDRFDRISIKPRQGECQ
jgi:hypothetical protein